MNTLCATACLSVIQGEGCILSAFKVSIKVLMEVSCIDAKDWGFNEICDGSEMIGFLEEEIDCPYSH